MKSAMVNVQDIVLNYLIREKTQVTFHLLSSAKITGVVQCFDNFTIAIQTKDGSAILYKHAVACMIPLTPIDINSITRG